MQQGTAVFCGPFLALLIGAASALAQGPQYTVNDLGAGVTANAINYNGQVVGCIVVGGNNHAFGTAPNAPVNPSTDDLGTLGGSSSCAYGINSSGQVVGASSTANGAAHGFRTSPNAPINPATDDIGTLGGSFSTAYGINDSGQVTGGSSTGSNPVVTNAFLTAPNSPINPATDGIPFSGPYNQARGRTVNSNGDVQAEYQNAGGYWQPFVAYSDGSIAQLTEFIYAPGQGYTGINDSDQVAGNGGSDLDVWQAGAYSVLVPGCDASCTAEGINNSLEIVGYPAFLVYTDGTLYGLNTLIPPGSGWVLSNAVAINDLGQIIGSGTFNGVAHAFRLDPASSTSAPKRR